jgi:hypothetical protein
LRKLAYRKEELRKGQGRIFGFFDRSDFSRLKGKLKEKAATCLKSSRTS